MVVKRDPMLQETVGDMVLTVDYLVESSSFLIKVRHMPSGTIRSATHKAYFDPIFGIDEVDMISIAIIAEDLTVEIENEL